MPADVNQLASRIKLLLMDVDGVMTDGRLYNVPDAAGNMVETKGFDSQDGIALQWLSWKGIRTGLISGRVSPATIERAKQTKFTYVYQGHIEKIPILEEILAEAKIDRSVASCPMVSRSPDPANRTAWVPTMSPARIEAIPISPGRRAPCPVRPDTMSLRGSSPRPDAALCASANAVPDGASILCLWCASEISMY